MMASSLLVAAGFTDVPKLDADFYTGALRSDSRTAGPTYQIKDGICCPVTSIALNEKCAVQTQSMGSDTYEQGSKSRTRSDSPHGQIVTWFGEVMKQMAIEPSNHASTHHKYECAAFCPLNGTFYPSISIGDVPDPPFSFTKPRHLRTPEIFTQPSSVGGQSMLCDRWRWEEKISVLPMGFITAYLDPKTAPPSIFGLSKAVVPFRAWENVSFVGFQPASRMNASLDDFFDIDPESIAKCPRAKECLPSSAAGAASIIKVKGRTQQDEIHAQSLSPSDVALVRMGTAIAEGLAEALANAEQSVSPVGGGPPPPPLPNVTFVTQYTSTIEQVTVADQYSRVAPNGDLCCSYGAVGAPPACAASIAKTAGVRYYDLPAQKYRFEGADSAPGNGVVVDYNAHKRYFVKADNTTGVETCHAYCPVDPRDTMRPDFFGFGNAVTDAGRATWEGRPAEHYHWVVKASPLPIPLQTIEFYADISDPAAAIPLFKHEAITPLGAKPVGYFNISYVGFKAGPPDPKKMAVAGTATCPKSPNCKLPSLQAERLELGQYHTFMRYHTMGDF